MKYQHRTLSLFIACALLFAPVGRAATALFAAPTAASFSIVVPANRQSAVTLQGADSDGTSLSYAIAAGPAHGTLSGLNTATGVVVYTPAANYKGADSFTYTVTSGGDTTAAATVTLSVSNAKTRIIDSVVDSGGVPRSGKVTFILTQQVASPDGLTPAGSTVSASLSNGTFDISIFPSRSLSPNAYYQVWWSDASTTNKELLGVYDIPLSTTTITLAAHKIMDTNLAARYTFASTAAVAALTTAAANATLAQLLSVSRTTGRLQKWDGGNVSDSIISESGSTVTVNGTLAATSITGIKSSDLPTEIAGKTLNSATINSPTVVTPTITSPTITGTIAGNQTMSGNLNVGGVISGNGSGLIGVVAPGVGGSSSTSTLTMRADSDNTGADGDIAIMPGNFEALRFKSDGRVTGTRRITGETLLSEYAVPNDGLDDGAGLQAALNAMAASGTTTLIWDGEYKITTPVAKSFHLLASSLTIRGRGARSVMHIASGTGTTALSLSNAENITFEDLNIRGTVGASTDARIALLIATVKKVSFKNVTFFGVASAEVGGAVLKITGSEVSTQNLAFRGCTGYFINSVPVMLVDNWVGGSMRDTDFIDYGTLNGVGYSKTGTPAEAWLKVLTPHQENEGIFTVDRAYLDEGPSYGMVFSSVTLRAHIVVKGVNQNVNGTDIGFGIAVSGARTFRLSQSRFGFADLGSPRYAVMLGDMDSAIIEHIETADEAKKVFASSTVKSLRVEGSTIDTLESNATGTRVEDSIVGSYTGTSQFEVHRDGKRIFGGTVLPTNYATEFKGGVNITGLPSVTGLTAAANVCCPGTTWTYYVIAVDPFGRRTLPTSYVLTQGWAADVLNLSGGAYHNISWNAVPGAASYLVFRSDTATLLGSTTSTAWVDGGETPSNSSYVANSVNETAPLIVEGQIKTPLLVLGSALVTSGAGAPSGTCTVGVYIRTDGGAGTTFYVCEGGSWAAK